MFLIDARAGGTSVEVIQSQLVISTFTEDLKGVEMDGVLGSIPQPGSEANWSGLHSCQVVHFRETYNRKNV